MRKWRCGAPSSPALNHRSTCFQLRTLKCRRFFSSTFHRQTKDTTVIRKLEFPLLWELLRFIEPYGSIPSKILTDKEILESLKSARKVSDIYQIIHNITNKAELVCSLDALKAIGLASASALALDERLEHESAMPAVDLVEP